MRLQLQQPHEPRRMAYPLPMQIAHSRICLGFDSWRWSKVVCYEVSTARDTCANAWHF